MTLPTPATPERPLAELLAELEEAIQSGNPYRAELLRSMILQRLATEAADRDSIERRVQALTAGIGLWELSDPTRGPSAIDLALDRDVRRSPTTRGEQTERGAPTEKDLIYPVWFGTNRKPLAEGTGFGSARHDRITRGRVDVHVPKAHRFGETGSSFLRRLFRFDLRDDRLQVQRIETLERDDFFHQMRQVQEDAARAPRRPPHALFFLHGYHNTFEEAAIRAAQLGCDLSVSGATAFFSWPSRGSVTAYPADEATIEASERAITEFLVDFAANCGAEKVHVVAHSMGNRGLLRALQRIASKAETRGSVKFGQIFLAAPDIDRDLFLDLAELYPAFSERTTLYTSRSDLPVHLSSKLHDAPRAGYFTPYTVAPGLDTIAVPDFDIDLLGHSYFAQAEAMLHDMFDLMAHGEPPDLRQRLDAVKMAGQSFWQVRR
jgi:esterase/lipase superfamily enzyme